MISKIQGKRLKIVQKAFFIITILFFIFTEFSARVFAQKSDDVIRVDTELVAFEVSVTDKDGKPVRGLNAEGF